MSGRRGGRGGEAGGEGRKTRSGQVEGQPQGRGRGPGGGGAGKEDRGQEVGLEREETWRQGRTSGQRDGVGRAIQRGLGARKGD